MFNKLINQLGYEYVTAWGRTHLDEVTWGRGSLVCGMTLNVRKEGKTFAVRYRYWEYNCDMDLVADITEEGFFRRHADVLNFISERGCYSK